MSEDVILCNLLGELIEKLGVLTTLLRDDIDYFRRNDLSLIEKNNIKKNEANEQLIDTLTRFNSVPGLALSQGNLYEQLLQHVNQRQSPMQDRMKNMLADMHNELDSYNHLLNMNRQIVTANMDFVRDLFSSLINHQPGEDSPATYDRQGLLERA